MMRKDASRSQRGFTSFGRTLGIAALLLLAVAGVYVLQEETSSSARQTHQVATAHSMPVKIRAPIPADRTLTYRNDAYGYSIDYPPSWLLQKEKPENVTISHPLGIAASKAMVAPLGASLEISAIRGGKIETARAKMYEACTGPKAATIDGMAGLQRICQETLGSRIAHYFLTENNVLYHFSLQEIDGPERITLSSMIKSVAFRKPKTPKAAAKR